MVTVKKTVSNVPAKTYITCKCTESVLIRETKGRLKNENWIFVISDVLRAWMQRYASVITAGPQDHTTPGKGTMHTNTR